MKVDVFFFFGIFDKFSKDYRPSERRVSSLLGQSFILYIRIEDPELIYCRSKIHLSVSEILSGSRIRFSLTFFMFYFSRGLKIPVFVRFFR